MWIPLAILFAIGIFAFVIPSWTTAIVNLGQLSNISESWAGFAGAIIAAVMVIVSTIGTALIAWFAVDRQIRSNVELADKGRTELLPLVRQDVENICLPLKFLWQCANLTLQDEDNEKITGFRIANVFIAINYLAEPIQIERLASNATSLGPINERRIDQVLFVFVSCSAQFKYS